MIRFSLIDVLIPFVLLAGATLTFCLWAIPLVSWLCDQFQWSIRTGATITAISAPVGSMVHLLLFCRIVARLRGM